MADNLNLTITLDIVSKPDVKLDVQGMQGTEHISQPFSFVVYATTSGDFDAASLVGDRAKLKVTSACGECVTSGLCFQVEELDPTATDLRVLQFVIRPRFAVTELAFANRIFGPGQAVGVDEVVKQELTKAQISIPAEYHLDSYPKRNYIVQYDESDFAFMSRLCERAGIFYFFKQQDDGETIAFGDKNLAFPKVKFGDRSAIFYAHPRDRQMARKANESAVLSFRQRLVLSTKSIKMRDYNEAVPTVVTGDKDVGQGNAFLGKAERFGGHLADDGAAATQAKVRAEQIAAGHTVFVAETDAPELRAGVIFELQGHPRLDGEYLVIGATHSAYRPAPLGFNALPQTGSAYRNVIECIRADVPYRPPLLTPVPAGVGLHAAKVDGEAWNGRAEIDSEGRYKLQLTFADEAAAKGRGSDFVRKVEPYVGPSQTGLHFPLVAGTEVLVAYLNGDIDRPVVLGAVSNPDMRHVVTSSAHLFNRIKSQSGALLEMYDGPV
ncbi:type VI secretion system tip protein VgrG [Microbacteriaceae bacterium K1510]|nr:type VI secretion system tip protein VgrG [Microbacteriaceae bacterium K1510]